MMTLDQFVSQHGITAAVKRLPDMRGGVEMRQFRVKLMRTLPNGTVIEMAVTFVQGMAWTTDPTASEVLDALKMEASGADQSFEEWCSEYGYEESERRVARRTYDAVRRQNTKLRVFLDQWQYAVLMSDVEGL